MRTTGKRMKKQSYTEKIISILFPISLFVDSYMIPGTDNTPLGTTIFMVIALFLVVKNQKLNIKDRDDKLLIIIALYLLVDQIIVTMRFSYIPIASNFRQLFTNIALILAIVIVPKYIDYRLFYKVFSFLVVVSCIGLLYQCIQVYLFKGTTRMIVLPGMYQLLSPASKRYIDALYNRMRPSSFFTEPSAFPNFTIPMIVLALKNKNYKLAVLVTVCNVLTTSTIGIFLSVAIWMYWIFFAASKQWIKVLTAVLFVSVCFIVVQSSFFRFSLVKIQNTDYRTNERIASGFTVFAQMPIADKITGVGLENVANYILYENINMSNVMVTAEGYVTSAFGNFVKIGIIGGVLYLFLCTRMLFAKNRFAILIAIIILLLSFIQTISFNGSGMWWFIIYKILNQYTDSSESMVRKGLQNESISH